MPAEKVFDGGFTNTGLSWVGIDQSYTGFAITALGDDDSYISWVYKSPETGVKRLLDIESWMLRKLHDVDDIQELAIESPVLRTTNALMAGQLYGVTMRALHVAGWEGVIQVPPTTLKKYVTGTGAAEKSLVMMSTLKNWGAEIPNDNAADAYGLARIASGYASNAVQKKIINDLRDPKFRS